MINTKCPECSARFYVSDELVAGKIVRFRCRKCGGTITVDGSLSGGQGSAKATEGSDDMLLSRFPAAPKEGVPTLEIKQSKERPATLRPPGGSAVPVAKSDQEASAPPPPPPAEPAQAQAKDEKAKGEKAKSEKSKSEKAKSEKAKSEKAKDEKAKDEKAKDEKKKKPLAARPVPLPVDDGTKAKEPAGKPADGDGDPTALWQKGDKKSGATVQNQGPSSKPRLSRVSMDLGSVFEMPTDEEEVEVPLDLDDAPAFEEEIEPEPMSLIPESLEPESLASGSGMKPLPPQIKPPAPKARKFDLDRPSSGVIDFSAAMARRDEEEFEAPEELFGPAAIPADALADLTVEPESPPKERRVSGAALAPALPALEPLAQLSEPPKPSGSRGMRIGLVVASLALLLGIGFVALRSGEEQRVASVPAATADPSTDDTAPAPATATVVPAQQEASAEEPSVAGAGTQPAAPSVESTVAKGVAPSRPVEPASEPTATATTTTTATAATPPATTAPAPAETKPVPKATATAAPTETGNAPFNKSAAASSINALKGAAQGCKKPDGPQGHARVSITFAPSGRVTVATISGPPFAGTPVGGCVAATFRRASVPPFSGANVTVHTSVAIF